jgi:hypothetical protein
LTLPRLWSADGSRTLQAGKAWEAEQDTSVASPWIGSENFGISGDRSYYYNQPMSSSMLRSVLNESVTVSDGGGPTPDCVPTSLLTPTPAVDHEAHVQQQTTEKKAYTHGCIATSASARGARSSKPSKTRGRAPSQADQTPDHPTRPSLQDLPSTSNRSNQIPKAQKTAKTQRRPKRPECLKQHPIIVFLLIGLIFGNGLTQLPTITNVSVSTTAGPTAMPGLVFEKGATRIDHSSGGVWAGVTFTAAGPASLKVFDKDGNLLCSADRTSTQYK